MKSEQRTVNSEQRTVNSEQRTVNILITASNQPELKNVNQLNYNILTIMTRRRHRTHKKQEGYYNIE